MTGVARMGDRTIGYCDVHGEQEGVIITASESYFLDGLGVARLNDIVRVNCKHVAKIITASGDMTVDTLGVARLGDQVKGDTYEGKIITASDDMVLD